MPHDHHHDHGHSHGHSHHGTASMGDGRLAWAVTVNLLLTVAQIAGGIVSGSLALVADAVHNLSDAAALGIALFARRVARRGADAGMTYGYRRAEIVAALINLTTLIVIGVYLAYEAVFRFFSPEPVAGWIVVIVAGVALAVDLVTAALTFAAAKHSLNIRAAFLHNVADALGSVVVIIAGALVIWRGWTWIDPAATLLIAGYILWHGLLEIRTCIRILMEAVPAGLDLASLQAAVTGVDGVVGSHHLHVWQLDERDPFFEAHVVIERADADRLEDIKRAVKAALRDRFGIAHSTLEFEFVGAHSDCAEIGMVVAH
ncbi:cation diffusion facilitator family transporter [Thalassobaculum sp.]|uniref:cation diffusion facilitator family transporter n=1 Tax=Thalassobaculum sp. TaxID=2022740 RepID=UPI0032EAFE95